MNELVRQFSHLFFGTLIAVFIYISPQNYAVMALTLCVFLGFVFSDAISRGYRIPLFSWIVDKLERDVEYPGKGTLVFLITALFSVVFFGSFIAFLSILTLAVLDSISTMAGISFGKHKIYGKKSAEGTLSGILTTFLVLLAFLNPFHALVASLSAGLTELFSPIDDNMSVPLITGFVILFLNLYL